MAKAQTVEEFDRRFDEGEDIFDLAEIRSEDITRPDEVDDEASRCDTN